MTPEYEQFEEARRAIRENFGINVIANENCKMKKNFNAEKK